MKTCRLMVLFGIIACVTFAVAPANAGITGSAHDFSGETWNAGGELCVVCHTPHDADTSVTAAPLWNHDLSTATYTLYSSSTLDATLTQPDSNSKLCLSCHDGTVAIDSFGENAGSEIITGGALIGTNLTNDHPISFTYDAALATTDGGLFDPTTKNSGLGSTINADMLFGDKLECASCHDVHDSVGNDDLLRVANSGSALCLTCHDK